MFYFLWTMTNVLFIKRHINDVVFIQIKMCVNTVYPTIDRGNSRWEIFERRQQTTHTLLSWHFWATRKQRQQFDRKPHMGDAHNVQRSLFNKRDCFNLVLDVTHTWTSPWSRSYWFEQRRPSAIDRSFAIVLNNSVCTV